MLAFQYTSQGSGYAGTEADLEAIFSSAPAEVDLFVVHGPVESMELAQKYIERCVFLSLFFGTRWGAMFWS